METGKPKYVGFRLICDSTEALADGTPAAKEDFCTCFNFVANIQQRMLDGRAQREKGQDGDTITVFAQEGDPIERRTDVGFNSMGEIVRPMPEIRAALERSGHKVATSDHAVVVTWKEISYTGTVPFYAEEMKRVTSHAQRIFQREQQEHRTLEEEENAAWERTRARMSANDEPVKRGPGRPPNPKPEAREVSTP